MKAFKVLNDSLRFLVKQPLFFAPNLISTTVWNAFLLYFLLEFGIDVTGFSKPPTIDVAFLYLTGSILVTVVSVYFHSMYPTLVKGYRKNKKFDFAKSMRVAWTCLPRTFLSVFLPVLLATALMLVPMVVAMLGVLTGNVLLMAIGFGTVAIITFYITLKFYFSPSSVIIDDVGVFESFRRSFRLSKKYRTETTYVVLISFALIAVAFFLPGTIRTASLAAFVILRYVTSLTAAYMGVVNPTMYLELRR
ncbi:MAG: hypothetical protein HYS81_01990 [Candidatus Aenigmatarchaeota archaeon]|nr:MAG: hypothetical protein HYS81_01990 [Candidatus Aenigmarchaeota archaeon]